MKILLSSRERIAGLFLLAAIGATAAFVVGAAIENRWLVRRVAYRTQVVQGEGLREGSPVLLSGIQVGEVGRLAILDDNRIEVELRVHEDHAHRVHGGAVARVQRLLGIGEKRIHLQAGDPGAAALPEGSLIPADEVRDILDTVANVDFGRYLKAIDRVVSALEVTLGKLEEDRRLERMMETFDQVGPTLAQLNRLLEQVVQPLATLVQDPSMRRAVRGADAVLNDGRTREAFRNAAAAMSPERLDALLASTSSLVRRLDGQLADGAPMAGVLTGVDRLVNDGRLDRTLTAVERLSDADKLAKLVDNLSTVAEQLATIGPQFPSMTREMTATMREAVVVLKALQKSWMLGDESEEVRREMKRK